MDITKPGEWSVQISADELNELLADILILCGDPSPSQAVKEAIEKRALDFIRPLREAGYYRKSPTE